MRISIYPNTSGPGRLLVLTVCSWGHAAAKNLGLKPRDDTDSLTYILTKPRVGYRMPRAVCQYN